MNRKNPNKPDSDKRKMQARREGGGAALVVFEGETIRIAPDAEVTRLRRTEPPLPISYLWTGRDEHGRIVVTRAEAAALDRLNDTCKGFCSRSAEGLTLSGHCGIVRIKTPRRLGALAGVITLEVLPTQWGGATGGADAAERAAELGAARRASMRMLASATGLPVSVPDMTRQVLENTALLDLFVRCFLREALRLTKHGLLAAHAGGACQEAHDEPTVDNPYNRALLAALEISRKNIRHTATERLWVDTRAMFASVSSVRMTARQVAQLKDGEETTRYRAALRWAEVLLDLLAPSPAAGKAGVRPLLFAMEGQFSTNGDCIQLSNSPVERADRNYRARTGGYRHPGAAPSNLEQRC